MDYGISKIISQEKIENHLLTNVNIMINMHSSENKKSDSDDKMDIEIKKKNKDKNIFLNNEAEENYEESSEEANNFECNYMMAMDEEYDIGMPESENLIQMDSKEHQKNYNNAVKNAENEITHEFETPGKAIEYNERHYYLENYVSKKIDNPLWLDFAEHIIKERTYKKFLSKNILYNKDIKLNEIIYILSIIDLPINSLKHEYKRNKNKNETYITPKSNIILFTKEIAECPVDLNTKLLINQAISDKEHNEDNININNCSINIKYSYQVIVTNISNKTLSFQLFIQIPEGAIGLNNTYYTNCFNIKLDPYKTNKYTIYFYFPKEGNFIQYYPVASQNNKIISFGNSLLYKVKKEFIPNQKNLIIEYSKYSKDMRIEGKLRNILSNEALSSEDKLEKILSYFKNDIFNDEDINNILYLLKNNENFFLDLINALRSRGYYNEVVWAFGFHHKDEKSIMEYLSVNEEIFNDLGYDFKSKLYSYNEIDDAKIHPHLEYNPIYNARKHPFKKNDNNNQSQIDNVEFRKTYEKFIIELLSMQEITTKQKLQLTYYLIIQDRLDEALDIFNRIKIEEIQNNNNNKSYKIQYDYLYAYLDFTFGYPDFKIAKSVCKYYKDFPMIHWKEKFQEIEDELLEYENKENMENIPMDIIEEENKDMKTIIKDLKEKEPNLSFNIENKEGKIILFHNNINEVIIKFYFIDLEYIFTREPQLSEIFNKNNENNRNKNDYLTEKFSFVKENYYEKIKLNESKNNKETNTTIYEIPKIYQKKNLIIEVDYESIKLLDLYLSSNLYVIITESIGELRVLDQNLKPLIKAYVKVYVKLNSNDIQFYKDGYTDLNGKFNYLALNTDQLKQAKKFYIYVSEENHGDILKECFPPKNIKTSGNEDTLEVLKKEKRYQRNLWRMLNKKRKGNYVEDLFSEKK